MTSFEYTYRLYSLNAIYESSNFAPLTVKIGLPPGQPGKPVLTVADFTAGSIEFTWTVPESLGGWPIDSYEIWVDDGAGTWPTDHILLDATLLTVSADGTITYLLEDLTGGETYGIKVVARNAIGSSVESDTQYLPCADLPDAPDSAPTLEAATETSITVAWNAPSNDGGSAVTGYRLYMNYLNDGDWELVYDGYL